MEKRAVGTNILAEVDGEVLTLRINLANEIGPSKSGKTTLIASTNGNAMLADGVRLGVNIFKKASN